MIQKKSCQPLGWQLLWLVSHTPCGLARTLAVLPSRSQPKRRGQQQKTQQSNQRELASSVWQLCRRGLSHLCGNNHFLDDQEWNIGWRRRRGRRHFAGYGPALCNLSDRDLHDLGRRDVHSLLQSPRIGHLAINVEFLTFRNLETLVLSIRQG